MNRRAPPQKLRRYAEYENHTACPAYRDTVVCLLRKRSISGRPARLCHSGGGTLAELQSRQPPRLYAGLIYDHSVINIY